MTSRMRGSATCLPHAPTKRNKRNKRNNACAAVSGLLRMLRLLRFPEVRERGRPGAGFVMASPIARRRGDLNEWHHTLHQVTGDMALRFNKATAADLDAASNGVPHA